jgi:hypothetical protein
MIKIFFLLVIFLSIGGIIFGITTLDPSKSNDLGGWILIISLITGGVSLAILPETPGTVCNKSYYSKKKILKRFHKVENKVKFMY